MKKILALVLALAMTASFAACGGSDADDTNNGADTTVGTSEAE